MAVANRWQATIQGGWYNPKTIQCQCINEQEEKL